MEETPLKAWEAFYVIVGSSAGALTGLQFVVLTLISESDTVPRSDASISAYGSPNVVHFCLALLISALCSAPWHGLGAPGVALTLCGVGGILYSIMVLRRARRQHEYKPVLEDWIWHTALPMVAYGGLVSAGIAFSGATELAVFLVGGATLLLVFIGIHNAWDTVMYITIERGRHRNRPAKKQREAPPGPS